MDEQKQITEEQFVLGQRLESLARQNAQQAVRIADLEAQLALIQVKAQQAQQPSEEQSIAGSEPLIDEGVVDAEDDLPVIN
tara:strand:+ start:1005 stop:1247 length:243 start_codon:yes stop_codon:yes gene_type:complete